MDFTKEDVVGRPLDLTDGQGVDTAIKALGADVTFQAAVKAFEVSDKKLDNVIKPLITF